MKAIARTFNSLSLIIVAGACISSIFISRVLESELSLLSIISLGISVWIIYTFDHYIDAKQLNNIKGKPRHQFHLENLALIKFLLIAAVCVNTVILIFLPNEVLIMGIILLLFITGYFMIIKLPIQYIGVFKELIIAAIYSAGIFIPAIATHSKPVSISIIPLYLVFFLLAWINLLLFSWFDFEYDRRAGFASLVIVLGRDFSNKIIWILLIIFYILWIWTFYFFTSGSFPGELKWITIAMAIILSAMQNNKRLFYKGENYRLVGDAIFLLPLMALLK
jgi:1,4-dihydroxy-2-naphthoate octaprenyltransferase